MAIGGALSAQPTDGRTQRGHHLSVGGAPRSAPGASLEVEWSADFRGADGWGPRSLEGNSYHVGTMRRLE
eukprot:4857033-Alexandrium_andersonii.AAC.1